MTTEEINAAKRHVEEMLDSITPERLGASEQEFYDLLDQRLAMATKHLGDEDEGKSIELKLAVLKISRILKGQPFMLEIIRTFGAKNN